MLKTPQRKLEDSSDSLSAKPGVASVSSRTAVDAKRSAAGAAARPRQSMAGAAAKSRAFQ